MNQEEVAYATKAIERFREPARDEAVRMVGELMAEAWEKFWENHLRKLTNYLMDPAAELNKYQHGLSVTISLQVDGTGVRLRPELSFGFREKYVGEEVEIGGQPRLDFETPAARAP